MEWYKEELWLYKLNYYGLFTLFILMPLIYFIFTFFNIYQSIGDITSPLTLLIMYIQGLSIGLIFSLIGTMVSILFKNQIIILNTKEKDDKAENVEEARAYALLPAYYFAITFSVLNIK